MAAPQRKASQQHVLTVVSTEWVSKHVVRLIATADSLADFADNGHTDAYVKLIFVDGVEPPYDLASLRATLPPERRPVVRTYTVRWFDRASRRIAIDFVTHGDAGIAAPWAAAAAPGDRFVFSGPGGGYLPAPDTGWHLLAGDLSALPAIARSLAAMPAHATGVVHLEVEDPVDVVEVQAPAGVRVNWLVNAAGEAELLAGAVANGPWPAEGVTVQVFAHGERESIKAIRRVLAERGVPREAISISAYWARGRTEDAFQAEKREPVGRIE